MTNQKSEKIFKIFNELKTEGLIDPRRVLELSTSFDSFHASMLKSANKIYYNPSMVGLDDDSIRFCLLHEEGHFINIQYGFYFTLFFSILGTIPFCITTFLISSTSDYQVGSILLVVLIVLFSFVFFPRFDEYKSDEFAALLIKKHSPQTIPSELLKTALDFIYPHGICFIDYHPSPANRVKKIKDRFDI